MQHRRTTLPVALAVAVVLGCESSPVDPPAGSLLWATELEAEGEIPLSGSAEAESTASEALVSIHVSGGDVGETYTWYVGSGAECGDSEARLGDAEDYPLLELDAEGAASAEASLDTGLDADDDYHVVVWTHEDNPALVACGQLQPAD
jgi:hypothetical protein